MNIRFCATALLLEAGVCAADASAPGAFVKDLPVPVQTQGEAVDSIVKPSLDDLEDGNRDSIGALHNNYAKEFNALKYVLEKRYRNYGDTFTKRWDDHLFVELGVGYRQRLKTGRNDMSALTLATVGLGKQFTPLHTARVRLGLGYGYYEATKAQYLQASVDADWLFSLTTFMDGYRPSRLLDVSTFVGGGVNMHGLNRVAVKKETGYNLHAGLQFKFFTGPQGYITLEPYLGVSSRWLDEKYGGNFGANLNFVYYLHNNLSIEERMRLLGYKDPKELEGKDVKKPQAWRTPWFFEASHGVSLFHGKNSNSNGAMGRSTSLAFGRWFSPAIGLRMGVSHSYSTWLQEERNVGGDPTQETAPGTPMPTRETWKYYNINTDIHAEALINPFGFCRNFSWDKPFGMALVLGGGVGRLQKEQEKELRTTTTSYIAGLDLWYQLSDGVKVFLEPTYTNCNYKIPYQNIDRSVRYSDDVINIRVGLSASTCSRSYRKPSPDYERPSLPLSFGLGVGVNSMFASGGYKGADFNYNALVFGEYHFSPIHTVRLGFEYLAINGYGEGSYSTYYSDGQPSQGGTVMFKHAYKRGLLALNYQCNISNLFSGYQKDRLFELDLFAGPSIMLGLGNSHNPVRTLNNDPDKYVVYNFEEAASNVFGVNGGLKLRLNATRHINVVLVPQINVLLGDPKFQGVNLFNKLKAMQTLNVGVQYNL